VLLAISGGVIGVLSLRGPEASGDHCIQQAIRPNTFFHITPNADPQMMYQDGDGTITVDASAGGTATWQKLGRHLIPGGNRGLGISFPTSGKVIDYTKDIENLGNISSSDSGSTMSVSWNAGGTDITGITADSAHVGDSTGWFNTAAFSATFQPNKATNGWKNAVASASSYAGGGTAYVPVYVAGSPHLKNSGVEVKQIIPDGNYSDTYASYSSDPDQGGTFNSVSVDNGTFITGIKWGVDAPYTFELHPRDWRGYVQYRTQHFYWNVVPSHSGTVTLTVDYTDDCGYRKTYTSTQKVKLAGLDAEIRDLSQDPVFIGGKTVPTVPMSIVTTEHDGNATVSLSLDPTSQAAVKPVGGEPAENYQQQVDTPNQYEISQPQLGSTTVNVHAEAGDKSADTDQSFTTYQLKLESFEPISAQRGHYSKLDFGIDGWDKIADADKAKFQSYFSHKKYQVSIIDKDGNTLPYSFSEDLPQPNPAGDLPAADANQDTLSSSFDIDTTSFTKTLYASTHDPGFKDHADTLDGAKLKVKITQTDATQAFMLTKSQDYSLKLNSPLAPALEPLNFEGDL